jgi:hypothetical protein
MSEKLEWEGSAPEPDASISAAMADDVYATRRETRLLNSVVNGIIAEHRRVRRIEEAASPAGVVTEQISPHQVATPEAIATIAGALKRIADHFDPPPPDLVDSVYVSKKLGCTTTWIADQARNGKIPAACLVPGTGNGKPWKFYREKIEKWITGQR